MDVITLALAKSYINKKINEGEIVTGATPQQAAQIEQNKTDIADLRNEVDELKESGGSVDLTGVVRSVNGKTPDEKGNVEIDVSNSGGNGNDGITPHIGENGNWFIGTVDTGVPAQGPAGENGVTPHIGTNGNWYIGSTDTGVSAKGIRGDNGLDGNGIKSAILNPDYTLTLTFDDDTTYTTPSIRGATGDTGSAGKNGTDGKDGSDGVGIASIKQTTTSTADGGNNVFTVTLTNGTIATFTVKNGSKGSTGKDGSNGVDGGHYTPVVTQPTTDTMQISFAPSKPDMPAVNTVTVNLPVSENSGQNVVQANWAQNDPTQPDFVKGRTHWEEGNQTVIEWDGNPEGRDSVVLGEFTLCKISDETPGKSELVGATMTANGETAEITDAQLSEGDGAIAIIPLIVVAYKTELNLAGVSAVLPDTGIYVNPELGALSLTYGSTIVHPLADKWIPDSIARKTDIPEPDTTLTQSGKAADAKAVGDALANVGKPTDEQVGNAVRDWLEAHPEATTVVADRSITVEKTTFIEPVSDNLIDMNKVVKGYQGDSGVPAGGSLPNTSIGCTTDYIQVEAGSTYTSSPDHGTGGIWTSWFYDAGKNPLAAISSRTFTVPDGAAYVRLSYALNTDISTLRLGLYRGVNPMVYTQGTQRYNLDPLLSAAIKAVHDSNSVFKVTAKNLYKPAADGTIDSATGKFTLTGGSLNISDYIEVTPGIYYASNCFGAPAYSAAYDKNRGYISAFSDAVEWGTDVYYDGGFYRVFKVIDPNVRYIVNGSSKSLSTPIKTPFIVRGNVIPDSLEGIDISTESVAYIEAAKKLLGITGNDLAGLTWAVLGDSITAASGVERSYHSIIAQKLGLTAINYGYNGSWISYTDAMPEGNEMCVRYATMTEDADIITCLGGINDINNNAALGQMGDTENTTFYGAMDLLIRGLLYKYPGKRIGFITPPRYGDGAREQPYIDAIHAVCEKYAVPVLDLYREGMASTATAELSATYFKDGLHPNELGHDVIARKVEAFLRRL